MRSQNESKDVLCCGARTWSLVIGWLQTIFSAIGIGLLLLICVAVGVVLDRGSGDDGNESNFVLNKVTSAENGTQERAIHLAEVIFFVVVILITVLVSIQLIAGILLIQGVNQKNVKKIQVWTIIQIIMLVFTGVHGIWTIVNGGLDAVLQDVIASLITIFFLWVVNIHQQEILSGDTNGVPVSYGALKP